MPSRRGLTPWIEKLIQNYDRDECFRAGGLQANVVDVGDMSQSQAQGLEGPTVLLFLSDEHVQIPAVLTARAWEELQEDEDRECFRSLLSHSVCITDYRLLFHMSAEPTRSKFYLSVGKLGTRAVVEINNTPCCTTLPSVQTKICQTWRAMSSQQDSQKSQFNLTDLLGEWQQDCLLTELEYVQKLLTVAPQSSATTLTPLTTLPDTCAGTIWEKDLVRYKGSNSFTVPAQHLLITDTSKQLNAQPQTSSESMGSETCPESTSMHMCSSDVATKQQGPGESTVSDLEDAPVILSGMGINSLSNIWDMCPPPSNTSSTKSSPQTSPVPQSPVLPESTINLLPVDTSTQISAHSKGSQKELLREPSFLPPYQRPPASVPLPSSTSSRQSANAPSCRSETADPYFPTSMLETAQEQLSRKCRGSLRKKGTPSPEDVIGISQNAGSSPPSWMFDSVMSCTSEQTISQTWGPPVGSLTDVHCYVHGDGKPFSYTYQVKGQELQQFSQFTVGDDLLRWATRYLLRPEPSVSTPENKDTRTTIS